MSKSIVTAAQVRAYFRDEAKGAARLAALPADVREAAAHTVAAGARGKVHPAAIKAFNGKRKTDRRYVEGTVAAAKAAQVAEVQAKREAARQAGIAVKDRGRLPKAVHALPKG